MAETTISRRRPCRNCGGRYFAGTMSIPAAILAIIAAVGGIGKAVVGSGVMAGGLAALSQSGIGAAAVWALGGLVVAAVVLIIGHGYRCIKCDTQQ